MNLVVVVCHYKEDLKWLNELKHPYIVYNKNPENKGFSINLENYGYDAVAYLKYVIENYNNLPDYVCFTQDNPFVHCPCFLEKVNGFKFDREFVALGVTYYREGEDILNRTIEYANQNNIPYKLPIKFTSGLQYIVSKTLIKKTPVDIYEKLLSTLPKNMVKTEINYYMEYLWATIFNMNEELQTGNICL